MITCNSSNLNNIDKGTPTNYQLIFPKIPTESTIAANNPFVMNIHTAMLPAVSLSTEELRWQGNKTKRGLTPMEFDPWTVSFTVDSRLLNWKLLFDWMSYINNNNNKISEYHNRYSVDCSLVVTDNYANSVLEVIFINIWPGTLGEVGFSQREGDILLESTITFNYDYFYIRNTTTWPTEFSSSSRSSSSESFNSSSSESFNSSSSSSSSYSSSSSSVSSSSSTSNSNSSSSSSVSSSTSSSSLSSLSSSISYGGDDCSWISSLINTSNINNPIGQARTGIYISPSGDYLMTTSTYNDYTYTYSLGTSFDISTMSFVRTTSFADVNENNGCWFTDDGLHMYLSLSTGGSESIRHYTLTTPWDTSTTTFSESYSLPVTTYKSSMTKLFDNGTIMVQGGYKYILSIPYDVSTATPSGDLNWLLTDQSYIREVMILDDGRTIYAIDNTNKRVKLYRLNNYLDFTNGEGIDLGIIVSGLPGLPNTGWVYEQGKIIVGDDGYNTQNPIYEYSYEYSCSSSSSSSSISSS